MLKSVIKLMETNCRKVGNHSRDGWNDENGHISIFMYHGNIICRIDWNENTCILSNCGWNTSSTNRTLNDYKTYISTHFPQIKIIDTRYDK